jgi:hypothetical protein
VLKSTETLWEAVGDLVGKANSRTCRARDRTAAAGLRSNERVIGRVTLSVQGDIGYIKLMRGLTGAEVLLRTSAERFPPAASRRDPPSDDERRGDHRWPAL